MSQINSNVNKGLVNFLSENVSKINTCRKN